MKNYQKGIDHAISNGLKYKDFCDFCKGYKYEVHNFYRYICDSYQSDAVDYLASVGIIPSRIISIRESINLVVEKGRKLNSIYDFMVKANLPIEKRSIRLFYNDLLRIANENKSTDIIGYLLSVGALRIKDSFNKYHEMIVDAINSKVKYEGFDEFCKFYSVDYSKFYDGVNNVLGGDVFGIDSFDYLALHGVLNKRSEKIKRFMEESLKKGEHFRNSDDFVSKCLPHVRLSENVERDLKRAVWSSLYDLCGIGQDAVESFLISKGLIIDSRQQTILDGIDKALKNKKNKFKCLSEFAEYCTYDYSNFEEAIQKSFNMDAYSFLASKGIFVGEQGKIIDAAQKAKNSNMMFDTLEEFRKHYRVKAYMVNADNTIYDSSCFDGDVVAYLSSNGIIPPRKDILLNYVEKARKEHKGFKNIYEFESYCGEYSYIRFFDEMIKAEFNENGTDFLKTQGILLVEEEEKTHNNRLFIDDVIQDFKNEVKVKAKEIKYFSQAKKADLLGSIDFVKRNRNGFDTYYVAIDHNKTNWNNIDEGTNVIIEKSSDAPIHELSVKTDKGRILGWLMGIGIGNTLVPLFKQGIVELNDCKIAYNKSIKDRRSVRRVYISFNLMIKENRVNPLMDTFDDYGIYSVKGTEIPYEKYEQCGQVDVWNYDVFSGITNACFRGLKPQIMTAVNYAADHGVLIHPKITATPGVYEIRTSKIDGAGCIAEYILKQFPELKMIAFFEENQEGFVLYSPSGCRDVIERKYISGIDHHNEIDRIYLYTQYPDNSIETTEWHHIGGDYTVDYDLPYAKEWNGFNYLIKGESTWNQIKKVRLPEGVETIGDYAYSYSESLETIEIPSSVYEISKNAFVGSDKLQKPIIKGDTYLWDKNKLISKESGKTIFQWKR